MAGIYIHIPFCRKACTYCDFHFSTNMGTAERVYTAMRRELEHRATYLKGDPVGTIYFGGGTPSLVPPGRLQQMLEKIHELYPVSSEAEITLEANPDDVTVEQLSIWKGLGITRISVGIQSFREDRLRFMGRSHDAERSIKSIEAIAAAGFRSWTMDLIYGLPDMSMAEWDEQLTIALDHGMPHLSAYCLTVEERTALAHQVRKGLVTMPEDAMQSAQFDRLIDRMEQAGLVQYEISNFSVPGHFSRHNSAYWEGVHYLGIGPSAHSFNGTHRQWNRSNNVIYAEALEIGKDWWEQEELTARDRTNERLLTGLRTMAGVDLDRLELDALGMNSAAYKKHQEVGYLTVENGRLLLTRAGRHFADRIASDLFVTDDR